MVGELAALLSSLNTAKDIAKTMVGLRDGAAFQAKVLEFQSAILDANGRVFTANEERSALIETIRDLEQKVAAAEAWAAEKQRYELKELGNGTMAYAVKESMRAGEPPHWICANCYADGKKSHLQPEIKPPGRTEVYVCHRCSSELIAVGGRAASLDRALPSHAISSRRPR